MAASAKVDAQAVAAKVDEARVDDPAVAAKAAEVKVDATSHALNPKR